MEFKILKSFSKDLKKINDKKLLLKIKILLEELKKTVVVIEKEDDLLLKISNTKKISGANHAYRIKITHEYRIGVIIESEENENKLIVEIFSLKRFLHRKDIYKKFPK